MTLQELEIEPNDSEPPEHITTLIREAAERIDQFIEQRSDSPIVGFVPSDFRQVYAGLRGLVDAHATTGSEFCEWG